MIIKKQRLVGWIMDELWTDKLRTHIFFTDEIGYRYLLKTRICFLRECEEVMKKLYGS